MREPLTDWNREWAACAEEAAGKARNELLPEWFNQFLTNVCELPDRNSPYDEPEAVVATLEELRNCAINAIEQCAAPTPIVAADAAAPSDEQILDLIYECNLGGSTEQQALDFAHRLLNF